MSEDYEIHVRHNIPKTDIMFAKRDNKGTNFLCEMYCLIVWPAEINVLRLSGVQFRE